MIVDQDPNLWTTIPLEELHGVASFLDPASSKTKLKRTAANMAIVTVASFERWIFVLEAWRARVTTTQLHEKVMDVVTTYRPRRFGCEANAMQSLFAEDINLIAKLKGIRLNIEPIHQPTNIEKPTRIRLQLQPVINYGRLFLNSGTQQNLIEELTTFPHGKTMDLVDALGSAIQLLPHRSADMQLSDTEEALRSYLVKVNMNPKLMDRRINQWREARGRQNHSSMLRAS